MYKYYILVCFSSSKERGGRREGRQRFTVNLWRPRWHRRAPRWWWRGHGWGSSIFCGRCGTLWRMRNLQEWVWKLLFNPIKTSMSPYLLLGMNFNTTSWPKSWGGNLPSRKSRLTRVLRFSRANFNPLLFAIRRVATTSWFGSSWVLVRCVSEFCRICCGNDLGNLGDCWVNWILSWNQTKGAVVKEELLTKESSRLQ